MTTQQPFEGYELPEDLRMLQRTVADFRDNEVMPLELQIISEATELPESDYRRLTQTTKGMGLWCLDAPENAGGAGLNYFWNSVLLEETSQHRSGFYTPCYGAFGVTPPTPIFSGTPDQIERYAKPAVEGERRGAYAITEPAGGSNSTTAIQTGASRDGDDWVLNGVKTYVMGGMQSDFVLVAARTDPDEPLGITCFIVEADSAGVNREYIPFLIASGIWPARITLENVRVPAGNVLGEINGGWKLLTEQLLWPNRIPFSAGNVGVGIAAHRLATEYSKQRETFGAPLSTRQAIQWMLVDNEVEMQAARWLTWQAAWAKDAGRPYEKEAAMAALVSAEGVCRTVDRSQQIHGGMGMSKWMPFERWYRESRARKLELGPMEVMRMSIAQHVLHPE